MIGASKSSETPLQQELRRRMYDAGYNMKALSRAAGLNDTAVRDILTGKTVSPRYRTMEALAGVLGCTVAELAGAPDGSGPVPPARTAAVAATRRDLPVMGIAVGGAEGFFDLNGEVHEYVDRPARLERVTNAYAVYVVGDSMEPRYFAGEVVYVNPNRPVGPGAFVVVELADGRGLIKRLQRRDDVKVVLDQFNPPMVLEFPASRVVHLHRIVQSGEA